MHEYRDYWTTCITCIGHKFRRRRARSGWLEKLCPECSSLGGIIMLRSYRPHYTSCPSICPSVCLSICPILARNSKTKNVEKSKLALTFSRARVSGMPIFSENVKGHGHRTSKKLNKLPHIWHTCLLTGGGSSAGDSGADSKTRPNLLSDARQLNGRPHIMSALGADIFSCSLCSVVRKLLWNDVGIDRECDRGSVCRTCGTVKNGYKWVLLLWLTGPQEL